MVGSSARGSDFIRHATRRNVRLRGVVFTFNFLAVPAPWAGLLLPAGR